ncbi:methyltransferase domain-containing protein [Actinomadura barringtoniae]|uniref:Methyltransferase domain-containing protein n=1 Tax=Actinomadura barringtoniae TaxID=1427535 RepID=A0A939T6I0_9ACTN|nr:class I SAM-dependent methyltransferase [Actinomadura barringtoniae]MBO2454956.1 methyltransferase domain-containing protein [Actinomadura barringtoniae]
MTQHPTAPADRYSEGAMSHDVPTELRRLQLLEEQLDPVTLAVLADRAVSLPDSARCLELGGGAGSVTRWMTRRFPAGRVTVVDVDTRYLDPGWATNLDVREEDVRVIDLPEGTYDLIHARALFMHLPEREELLKRAASWLAPGGCLVVEDLAMFPFDSSPHPAWAKVAKALIALVEAQGGDLGWSRRRQPRALADAGLTDLGLAVNVFTIGDGGPTERFWRAFLDQVGAAMVAKGLVTADEIAAARALFDEPSFVDASEAFVSAWGRRPVG